PIPVRTTTRIYSSTVAIEWLQFHTWRNEFTSRGSSRVTSGPGGKEKRTYKFTRRIQSGRSSLYALRVRLLLGLLLGTAKRQLSNRKSELCTPTDHHTRNGGWLSVSKHRDRGLSGLPRRLDRGS